MLFGRKKDFAIECELDEDNEFPWLNCSFRYWINDQEIGDYERGAELRVLKPFYEDSINVVSRYDASLADKPANDIVKIIFSNLYNDDTNHPGISKTTWQALNTETQTEFNRKDYEQQWKEYHKFDIATNFAPALDGWAVLLMDDLKFQRFIWGNWEEKILYENHLPLNTYEFVVSNFLKWATVKILENSK